GERQHRRRAMGAEQQADQPTAQNCRTECDEPRCQNLDPDRQENVPECSTGSGLGQPDGGGGDEETDDDGADGHWQVGTEGAASPYNDGRRNLLPIPERRAPRLISLEEISDQRVIDDGGAKALQNPSGESRRLLDSHDNCPFNWGSPFQSCVSACRASPTSRNPLAGVREKRFSRPARSGGGLPSRDLSKPFPPQPSQGGLN